MATGKAEWVFSIIDKASGPTSVIERKLGLLERRISAVDRDAKSASDPAMRDRLSYQRLGLELQRDQMLMRQLNSESGTWLRNLHAGLSVLGMIGGAVRTVVGGMVDLGLGAAKFTAAFGQRGIQAAAYKESNLAALEILLGDRGKAEKAFEQSKQFAAATPFQTADVLRWQKNLLVGGFSPEDSQVMFRGLGDLAAMNDFDPQIVDRASLALKQIKAKGRFMGQEMLQLSEAGVSQKAVYSQLAKMFGTDVDGVRKLQEQGGISADQAIFAVFAAIRDTVSGGRLGSTMERFGKETVQGLMSTLMSKPSEFLMDLDRSGGFKTFKSAVNNLLDALKADSDTARGIASTLDQVFTDLLDSVFGKFTGPDGPARLKTTIDELMEGFERVTAVGRVTIAALEGLASGLFRGLDPAGDLFRDKLSPEKLEKVSAAAEKFGVAIGKLFDLFTRMVGGSFDEDTPSGRATMGWLDDISQNGLVPGLLKGLIYGWPRALSALSDSSAAAAQAAYAKEGPIPRPRDWRDGAAVGQAMARSLNVRVEAPIVVNGAVSTPEQIEAASTEAARKVKETVSASLSAAAASQGA